MTDATNDEARVAEIRGRCEAGTSQFCDSCNEPRPCDRMRLVAVVEAVLGLHVPRQAFDPSDPPECSECVDVSSGYGTGVAYPCPTVNAVTEALGGEL